VVVTDPLDEIDRICHGDLADYEHWCYCSWCLNNSISIPHLRREGCPHPDQYVSR